jgi:hypothetical protein
MRHFNLSRDYIVRLPNEIIGSVRLLHRVPFLTRIDWTAEARIVPSSRGSCCPRPKRSAPVLLSKSPRYTPREQEIALNYRWR